VHRARVKGTVLSLRDKLRWYGMHVPHTMHTIGVRHVNERTLISDRAFASTKNQRRDHDVDFDK
jgi:hypothetical protein